MQKKEEWEKGQEIMLKVYNQGAEKYFNSLPKWKESFVDKHDCAVCMDEGMAHKEMGDLTKFAMAGSGMLFPADSEEERLEKVTEIMKKLRVTEVTSHGGCGAAGLAFKRDNPGVEPTPEQVENLAIDWAKKLADKLGVNFKHVPVTEMARPAEYHNARVIYFDGTGKFNPRAGSLPMGFVISRAHLPAEYAAEELKVAVNIAFGHHGLGDLLTKDSPLEVVILASEADKEKLTEEVVAVLEDNENYLAGRIKVEAVPV